MSQERDDCVATYLGLQEFVVVAVERVRHPNRGPAKVVRVERRDDCRSRCRGFG